MYITKNILKQVYKKRDKFVHKGNFGRLLVISGSSLYTGSPCFISLAAYRSGVDLVYMAGIRRAADVVANFSPNVMTISLEEELNKSHTKQILDFIEINNITAVVIGPGLLRNTESIEAINYLVELINVPMVIDATAIRAASQIKDKLKFKKCILTPHADEFKALTGIGLTNNLKERIKAVANAAKKLSSVVLLKGNVDIISDGYKTMLNKTGSPMMSKGGMGDTLAGIAGALLARNIDLFTAACASAYINGKAGELAIKKFGESSLATDLIEKIPEAIKL